MKKKKVKIIITVIICIVVLLGSAAYYLVYPAKKIAAPEKLQYNSMSAFVLSKSKDILKDIQNNGTNDISAIITEDEANQMLELSRRSLKDTRSALSGVTAMHVEFGPNADYLYISQVYNKIITTQYIVKFVPEIVNNRIAVKIEDVKLGRINLPRSLALKRMKGKSGDYIVNEKDETIIVNTDFPKALTLKSVNSGEKKLELHFAISLDSINDLKDLMNIIQNK